MLVARPALAAALAASVALVAFTPSRANAGTFDADGNFVPDPAAVFRYGFDSIDPDQVDLERGRESGGPLEGTGYAVLNSTQSYFELPLPDSLEPGTYTLRFLARHNRVVGGVSIGYATTATDPGDPSFYATAYPTGVVTSDGWYEVATAPFSLDPTRAFSASVFMYATGADLDALELVRDAAPATTLKTCLKAFDSACSASEFCSAGFCRDGNVTVPGVPPAEAGGAAALVAYLQSRVELFFGGRYTRSNRLPIANQVYASLAGADSGWELWNGFATALHRLRDWHTSMSGPTEVQGRGAFPLCFVEGDADLTHAVAPLDASYPDVLVSHGTQEDAASGTFGPGDRLVAIDGMHPLAWMDSLDSIDWGYWHSNDPDGHAEAAERLRNNVRRFAHELTVLRCDRVAGTCAAATDTVLVSDLPKVEPAAYPSCDHRPGYLIDGPDPVSHRVRGNQVGKVRDTTDEEAINAMVWNNVNAEGTTNPFLDALNALTTGAKGVILDHRTGNGGTEPAAEFLTQPFRAPALLGVATGFNLTLGFFDDPFDGLALFTAGSAGRDAYNVGSAEYNPTLKTALLLARDGSASDWFPLGMKGAPNVRIFGRRTAGAFSSFFQFDYYGNLAWQFGSGDFIQADGAAQLGHGVQPDEMILPKQSDLIAGKDTVALRALAWIREGL